MDSESAILKNKMSWARLTKKLSLNRQKSVSTNFIGIKSQGYSPSPALSEEAVSTISSVLGNLR